MKSQFVSTALLTTLAIAVLFLTPIRTPAQNAGPKDGAKTTAGSAYEGEIMDDHCAQMGSHEMTMKANNLATPELCTTYCVDFQKTPGKYVLYNAATKTIYQLDDQNQARFFGGRKVKVIGAYDPATKTIRVKDITSAPAS